jgi:hypothetical protein
MAGVTFRIVKLMFLSMIAVALLLPQSAFAEGYDIIYDDPTSDVEDMLGGGSVRGYEHLDITQIRSYEANFGTHLVLEMTVVGLITDSEDIIYSFNIMDGEEEVYYIYYSDGVCTGYDYESGSSSVLQASGAGSDTLEIRIQISEVEDIIEYDFYGEALEYDDGNNVYPMDRAPDMDDDWYDDDDYYYYDVPIMITEPRPGSTVYGTKTIKGVTEYWGGEIESVEVQLDSTYSGGWQAASSTDSWETWSFEWDTTSYSDGEHTINARAYDGSDHYHDSIDVYVDQSNEFSPRTTEVPELAVGLELEYEIIFPADSYYYLGDTDIDAEMTMKVIDKETIEVDNEDYETYTIEMKMTMSMKMTYDDETMSVSMTMDSLQWLRVSDLATIKMEMEMQMSYSYFGMSGTETQEATSTCDPPLDSYNFPISIGEIWEAESTVTTTTRTSGSLSGGYSDTDVSETIQDNEALHVEDVIVSAGTFETFVIWSGGSSDTTYGGGTSLLTSGSSYTLTYYSPELGFPVKTESYDNNRDLQLTMELTSYKGGQGQSPAGISSGWELPFYFLLIPLLVIIILASVMVAKRRRRDKAAAEPKATYTGTGGAIPYYLSQPAAYAPTAYPVQPTQHPPQAYPIQTASHAQPVGQQPAYYGQPRQVYATQPYQYTPSVSPAYVTQPYSPQPRQTAGYQAQFRHPVSPKVEVECPNCTRAFSVPLKSAKVQCPFCKTTGRME